MKRKENARETMKYIMNEITSRDDKDAESNALYKR